MKAHEAKKSVGSDGAKGVAAAVCGAQETEPSSNSYLH